MDDHHARTHADPAFPRLDIDPATMNRHLMRARRLRAEATADLFAHMTRAVLSAFRLPFSASETGRRQHVGAPLTDLTGRCGAGLSSQP